MWHGLLEDSAQIGLVHWSLGQTYISLSGLVVVRILNLLPRFTLSRNTDGDTVNTCSSNTRVSQAWEAHWRSPLPRMTSCGCFKISACSGAVPGTYHDLLCHEFDPNWRDRGRMLTAEAFQPGDQQVAYTRLKIVLLVAWD